MGELQKNVREPDFSAKKPIGRSDKRGGIGHIKSVKIIISNKIFAKVAKIKIIQGDITRLKVDAIVNAANKTLLGGGGVDGAIHRAAGPKLLEECAALHGCETGQAKITKGYNLPAKHIIHTVGPVWRGGKNNEEKLLALCYRESFKLAEEYKLKSIAFPAISCGIYGFPIERAAKITLSETKRFLEENSHFLQEIIFVLFSENDYNIYRKVFKNIKF